MNVICLQEEAFYELVETVVDRLKDQVTPEPKPKWIGTNEAMELLRVKSKTTLQKLRDEPGGIRFSQPQKKIILYDRASIEDYLETHAKNPF